MNRKLLTAVALAAGPFLWASAANADLIGIGGATGTMTFTAAAGNTVNFNTTGFTATNLATWQVPTGNVIFTGTATFGAMTGTASSTGIISNQVPVGETFSFTQTIPAGTNTLNGTIAWPAIASLSGNTPQFDVNALLNVTSCVGCSGGFAAAFPVGSQAGVDFTLNLPLGTSLQTLAAGPVGSTLTGTFSSGEVIPRPPGVPEPASLALLGSALMGFGLLRRRNKRM